MLLYTYQLMSNELKFTEMQYISIIRKTNKSQYQNCCNYYSDNFLLDK